MLETGKTDKLLLTDTYLDSILSSSKLLSNLIHDLLDYG